MIEKTGILGGRLCTLCALCFCGLILLQNLQHILTGQPLVVLAALVGAAAVVLLCIRFLRPFRGFAWALFSLRFALALLFILWLDSQPVQDFNTMYTAAAQLAQGSHAYLEDVYFFNWAYQSGFVAYEALVIRLFGSSLLPLQLLNALWLALTNVLVYRIGCRFLPEKAAMTVSILYAIYPAPLFLAGVLTNQHLSVLLLYCALWVLVSGRELTPARASAAGALIALGNAIRPIGVVLLLAAVIWIMLRAMAHNKRTAALPALWTAASYVLVGLLLSGAITLSGINPEGLTNNQPMWKFVVGLNQTSSGSWNSTDYEQYLSLPTDEAHAAMTEAVRDRLSVGPAKLAGLALRKSSTMWAANEDLFWGFGHLDEQAPAVTFPFSIPWGTLQRLLAYCDKGVYLLSFALALAGLFLHLFKKDRGGIPLVLVLLLCGYYAVHLIVEVQSRYRYFLMPCVFLLAGIAVARLLPDDRTGSQKP
jgi:hypothetical protein